MLNESGIGTTLLADWSTGEPRFAAQVALGGSGSSTVLSSVLNRGSKGNSSAIGDPVLPGAEGGNGSTSVAWCSRQQGERLWLAGRGGHPCSQPLGCRLGVSSKVGFGELNTRSLPLPRRSAKEPVERRWR